MVTKLQLFSLLLLTSITFSCHKNQDSVKNDVFIAADINSSAGTNIYRGYDMPDGIKTTTSAGTQLTITARRTAESVTLVIKNYIGVVGSFPVIGVSGDAYGAYNIGLTSSTDIISDNPSTSPGIVIIERIDQDFGKGIYLNGSFNFKAGKYELTKGTFRVYLPK